MADEITDPTAGRRARMIREHPEAPQVVTDPTDPRAGAPDRREEPALCEDPTDPRFGERAT